MNYSDLLYQISPHFRYIRQEELSIYGNWVDYDHVFTYISKGEADFIINGVCYTLKKGDVILIPPYMHHLVRSHHDTIIQYVMHFDLFYHPDRASLKGLGLEYCDSPLPPEERFFGSRPIVVSLNEKQQVFLTEKLTFLLWKKQDTDNPWFPLQAKAILIDILALIFQCNELKSSFDSTNSLNWSAVRQTMDYVHLHYADKNLNNAAISKVTGLSENYLCTIFRQQIGISIHEYLLNTRIARAEELLLYADASITEIAEMTGFSGIHAFSRAFKKFTGKSPSSFRNASPLF